jgi:hypothetical protein
MLGEHLSSLRMTSGFALGGGWAGITQAVVHAHIRQIHPQASGFSPSRLPVKVWIT